VARRGDEAKAEPFQIVEHVAERMDLELATVARARVDLTDRERSPEAPARGPVDAAGQFGERRSVRGRRGLGERSLDQALEQQSAHVDAS